MKALGIKPRVRKYILGSVNLFKSGHGVREVKLPVRQKKYLKDKKMVETLRLQKLGLA
jgi:hypothetical protein